jgi:hypothetical protein
VLEQVVGLLVNHLELVSLSGPDGQLNQLITNWLVSVIHAAPENSADRFARGMLFPFRDWRHEFGSWGPDDVLALFRYLALA